MCCYQCPFTIKPLPGDKHSSNDIKLSLTDANTTRHYLLNSLPFTSSLPHVSCPISKLHRIKQLAFNFDIAEPSSNRVMCQVHSFRAIEGAPPRPPSAQQHHCGLFGESPAQSRARREGRCVLTPPFDPGHEKHDKGGFLRFTLLGGALW